MLQGVEPSQLSYNREDTRPGIINPDESGHNPSGGRNDSWGT